MRGWHWEMTVFKIMNRTIFLFVCLQVTLIRVGIGITFLKQFKWKTKYT